MLAFPCAGNRAIGDDPAVALRKYAKRKRAKKADESLTRALAAIARGFVGSPGIWSMFALRSMATQAKRLISRERKGGRVV
jgi:hypothetical protein